MTELQMQAEALAAKATSATHAERLRLQPQIDQTITKLMMQGHTVPTRLRHINNALKDEALDDMFDNMPV